MGTQQIPDQVKRAPTEALRAVFSGIGRILLAAERQQGHSPDVQREIAALRATRKKRATTGRHDRFDEARPAPETSRWRSLDQTGNVRLLSATDLDDYEDVPVGNGAAQAAAALPIANYDSLSLPSIRARLRGLDVAQLRELAEYERQNAERPEVVGMFERRICKLETLLADR